MSDEPQVISPRGVPPIRTDWLADVARRLAVLGLDRLRELGEDQHGHLTDIVDGEPWTFELMKFSGTDATVVEFDADLWAPADAGGRPSLRAGFALAPRWLEEPAGPATLVRTEIGPRAAVTFDPENWFVAIPDGADVPVPAGVDGGRWSFDGDLPRSVDAAQLDDGAAADALVGLRLDLADLDPIVAGEALPEVVLGAYPTHRAKRGLLGRLKGAGAPPTADAALRLRATGALAVAWTGERAIEAALDTGVELDQSAPVLAGDQLTIRTSTGTVTITGQALTADIVRS